MSTTAQPEVSESQRRSMLVRAVVASTIGTSIEWYDFFLYSIVTGLVFAKTFFPQADPSVGLLNSFGIYFGGFAARPIGAYIFGHYGDRIGRKGALIATLLLMGVATFLVAFVPGYNQIGIWGAIILTFLRVVQGIGISPRAPMRPSRLPITTWRSVRPAPASPRRTTAATWRTSFTKPSCSAATSSPVRSA
jgi:MFS family permease